MTILEQIDESLKEATILEQACGRDDRDRVIYTATRLSGIPYWLYKEAERESARR